MDIQLECFDLAAPPIEDPGRYERQETLERAAENVFTSHYDAMRWCYGSSKYFDAWQTPMEAAQDSSAGLLKALALLHRIAVTLRP